MMNYAGIRTLGKWFGSLHCSGWPEGFNGRARKVNFVGPVPPAAPVAAAAAAGTAAAHGEGAGSTTLR